jgi:hypothetical protein
MFDQIYAKFNLIYFLQVRKPVFNEQQLLKVHLFFAETHQVPGNDREGQFFEFKSTTTTTTSSSSSRV